jgi:hypothetical protein
MSWEKRYQCSAAGREPIFSGLFPGLRIDRRFEIGNLRFEINGAPILQEMGISLSRSTDFIVNSLRHSIEIDLGLKVRESLVQQ